MAKLPCFSFPEIRGVQVEHLARSLLSSGEPWKTAALKRKIECYTSGALPHAQDVLPALYHRFSNPQSLRPVTPPTRSPLPAQVPQRDGFHWRILKAELTKSLTSGTFLNTELHAPVSRSSGDKPRLRPLYFCSAVGGECTAKILSCAIFLVNHRISIIQQLSFWLDVEEISGRDEALGDAYKCDSDIEDDEASESANESESVRAPR